jgi:hypothetical protein
MEPPQESGPLGKASLGLGIASSALVFGIGLCGLVGARQGWIDVAGTPLFICGASSAFLGLIGVVIGVGGMFSGTGNKALPVIGIILGLVGICLFLVILAQFQ